MRSAQAEGGADTGSDGSGGAADARKRRQTVLQMIAVIQKEEVRTFP